MFRAVAAACGFDMKVRREPGPGQAKLENLLKGLQKVEAQVGWFESAKYADTGIPVAAIAHQNEFGNPALGIPPRPFMRPTIKEKQKVWKALANQYAQNLLTGSMTLKNVMSEVAQNATGDIKYAIKTLTTPPLKEATVKARARKLSKNEITDTLRKPLIETGYMLNSCTYVVEVKA